MKDHKCRASSHQVDIRAAKSQMYEMVAKEPTGSLLEIYEVVRQKYTAQMDPDSKLLFLQEFPSFLDLKTALLAQRRKFIPPDPNSSRNKQGRVMGVSWISKKQQVDIGPGPVCDGKKIEADGPPGVG